jgi:rRNA maturation endonuclease Nob1
VEASVELIVTTIVGAALGLLLSSVWWIVLFKHFDWKGYYRCSGCGNGMEFYFYRICPKCGDDMTVEKEAGRWSVTHFEWKR